MMLLMVDLGTPLFMNRAYCVICFSVNSSESLILIAMFSFIKSPPHYQNDCSIFLSSVGPFLGTNEEKRRINRKIIIKSLKMSDLLRNG